MAIYGRPVELGRMMLIYAHYSHEYDLKKLPPLQTFIPLLRSLIDTPYKHLLTVFKSQFKYIDGVPPVPYRTHSSHGRLPLMHTVQHLSDILTRLALQMLNVNRCNIERKDIHLKI